MGEIVMIKIDFDYDDPEVRFVTAAGSVKFFASGVNFSKKHFFSFLSLKLLKFSEIKGVKSLAWKSGGVKFLNKSHVCGGSNSNNFPLYYDSH